ncbi:MAG: UDP-N-acetylmuramoyl-L-alanyl-D-glutamate--2,6-diaminopimelate ligase, partial [Bacteroidales bacterium]|nr:UDP-N-acetylmuramoyl-L-alanyl-D-glutamate--2,6-diaminopimelate ligase [Bacteroidales bacterium]
MKLKKIIEGLKINRLYGDASLEISRITFDSREVRKGDLFVAIRGTEADGHSFIEKAISAGAVAVVSQDKPISENQTVSWIYVSDSRKALALMASTFYGHPSRELQLVGITGTNGKTTIATLLHEIHIHLGFRAGLLSTIQVLMGSDSLPATHTTPD